MEDIFSKYHAKRGILDISIGEKNYHFEGVKQSEIPSYIDSAINTDEEEKVARILERISKASIPTREDIELGERVHRELSGMTAEDLFTPIGNLAMTEGERKKKEQYDRMMELAKDFDKPIPDEVMDELELFSAEWQAASYRNMDRILT